MLAARPVDAISIDEIVVAAGIAKGSFYNHFSDKAAWADEVSRFIRTDVEELVAAANQGMTDPAQRVCRGICVFVDFALREPQKAQIMLSNQAADSPSSSRVNHGLAADISRGIESGRFILPSSEVGAQFALVTAGAAISKVLVAKSDKELAALFTQQLISLMLIAFGLANREATQISAAATHSIIITPDAGS